ncbi:hypothetical protein ACV229_16895 [Burkholderia sp. MR1-5-21]
MSNEYLQTNRPFTHPLHVANNLILPVGQRANRIAVRPFRPVDESIFDLGNHATVLSGAAVRLALPPSLFKASFCAAIAPAIAFWPVKPATPQPSSTDPVHSQIRFTDCVGRSIDMPSMNTIRADTNLVI